MTPAAGFSTSRVSGSGVCSYWASIRLGDTLPNGLLDAGESARLTARSAPLYVYLTYEAISGNLAIGLAAPEPGNAAHAAQARLVRAFNDAMLARLSGAPPSCYPPA